MPDLREASTRCRFYNCTHRARAGLRRARRGRARRRSAPSRYRIYREIFDELRGAALSCAGAQPMRLASDSSASSSIHSTTERHTSPTTLRRWPSSGGTPGVDPSAPVGLGRRAGLEGLGAIRRDARRRARRRAARRRAPAAAARITPSLSCSTAPASRRQQLTASSKLPTTAKPNAVSRAGTWSSEAEQLLRQRHQALVHRRRRRCGS